MIPSAARMYCQLVESPVLASMSGLESRHIGLSIPPGQTAIAADGWRVASATLARLAACDAETVPPGLIPLHELHVAPLFEAGLIRPLSRPHLLLSFDLARPPPKEDYEHVIQV